jgi:hypothetical protein
MTWNSTQGIDMAYLLFGGDMLVTGFMVGVVIWLCVRENDERIAMSARIPLEDEQRHD